MACEIFSYYAICRNECFSWLLFGSLVQVCFVSFKFLWLQCLWLCWGLGHPTVLQAWKMSLGEMSVIVFCTLSVVGPSSSLRHFFWNDGRTQVRGNPKKISILCITRDSIPFVAALYVGLIALCSMLGGGGDWMPQTTFEFLP